MATKRSSSSVASIAATKRFRSTTTIGRLCDLSNAEEIFLDDYNASIAKEKGILRSRVATDKFRSLEKQLLELLQESNGIEQVDDEALRDMLPSELEADTASVLVAQVLRHQRYEQAAHQLASEALAELQEAHEREVQKLKLQHETDLTRVKVSADVRNTADVECVNEELQQVREEFEEKVAELEEKVAEQEREIALTQEQAREADRDRRSLAQGAVSSSRPWSLRLSGLAQGQAYRHARQAGQTSDEP